MANPIYLLKYTATDVIYEPLKYYTDKVVADRKADDQQRKLSNHAAMCGKELDGQVVVIELHEG